MFDWTNSEIKEVSVHHLDHSEGGKLLLSDHPLIIDGEIPLHFLKQYFLSGLVERPDYYSFTFSNSDATLNPVRLLIDQILEHKQPLHDISRSIASHLYQCSVHPNIKSGDLYVVRFDHVYRDDEIIEAIGIFKSETKDDFLKLIQDRGHYHIQHDIGLHIKKLDKGCMIYKTSDEEAYILSIIDRSNHTREAQYWKEDFLKLKAREDAYHQTLQYMNLAQSYVTHQMSEEFDVSKADQLDVLHRSGEYFKKNDAFTAAEFEEEIFGNEEVISSFEKYKDAYESDLNLKLPDHIGISQEAVKKSAKDFKSVLKLDKNFHVYIHGDRNMIESGQDDNGRKWYKLYYDAEL